MKRFLPAVAVLLSLTAAAPMFALDSPDRDGRETRTDRRDRTSVIDDVIRMTQAGVGDDAIIKFVRDSRERYVVDADVIIALTDAHVSKPVLDAVMDYAYDRDERGDRHTDGRTYSTVYVRPYYDPWYSAYSPYYYDPFWYGPRLSIGLGFGFGGYRGGHYYRPGGHFGGGHGGRGGHRH
ncbi:MAG: hypothetical protein JO197_01060 [Acidobacteria bacterium]|nr:hypothetical protein [Acidobacteriota bacterium]MBV9476295.1 hypothetical protein [Acidobacteriota bacterium]